MTDIKNPTASPLPATSPVKVTPNTVLMKTMNFFEALKQVADGKKISKLDWGNREYYGFVNGEILSLHKPDGKNYQWIISVGDLIGTDYVVI